MVILIFSQMLQSLKYDESQVICILISVSHDNIMTRRTFQIVGKRLIFFGASFIKIKLPVGCNMCMSTSKKHIQINCTYQSATALFLYYIDIHDSLAFHSKSYIICLYFVNFKYQGRICVGSFILSSSGDNTNKLFAQCNLISLRYIVY